MVHFLRLRGRQNSAEYGCRYVRTRGWQEEERAGRRLHMSLTQAPQTGPILRGMLSKGSQPVPDSPYWVIQSPNNANNGIKWHAGRLLATYEAGSAYELRLCRELTTLGVCSFGKGGWSYADHWMENFTAHSKVCAVTGELCYVGYNLVPFGGPPTVTVGVLSGVIWALENPKAGIVDPDEIDFQRIMEISTPYLGDVVGAYSDWTPLEGRAALFREDIDTNDPWQFKNFRVV